MIKFATAQALAKQMLTGPRARVSYTHYRPDPDVTRTLEIKGFKHFKFLRNFMTDDAMEQLWIELSLPFDTKNINGQLLRKWWSGCGWTPEQRGGATTCKIIDVEKKYVMASGRAVCHTCDIYVPAVGRELSLAYATFALAKRVYRDLYNTKVKVRNAVVPGLVEATIVVMPASGSLAGMWQSG